LVVVVVVVIIFRTEWTERGAWLLDLVDFRELRVGFLGQVRLLV
jgi:hypothetical protein